MRCWIEKTICHRMRMAGVEDYGLCLSCPVLEEAEIKTAAPALESERQPLGTVNQ